MTTLPIDNQDGDDDSDEDADVSDWEQLYEQDQLEDAVLIIDSHFNSRHKIIGFNEDGYIAHFYPFPRH